MEILTGNIQAKLAELRLQSKKIHILPLSSQTLARSVLQLQRLHGPFVAKTPHHFLYEFQSQKLKSKSKNLHRMLHLLSCIPLKEKENW